MRRLRQHRIAGDGAYAAQYAAEEQRPAGLQRSPKAPAELLPKFFSQAVILLLEHAQGNPAGCRAGSRNGDQRETAQYPQKIQLNQLKQIFIEYLEKPGYFTQKRRRFSVSRIFL